MFASPPISKTCLVRTMSYDSHSTKIRSLLEGKLAGDSEVLTGPGPGEKLLGMRHEGW